MRFCARSFALISSTAAAEGRSMMRVFRCGGFRTAFAGFESMRRHSTARWRMPWRKASVFRTVGSPTPAAVRSARKLAMSSGVSSRSAIVAEPRQRRGDPRAPRISASSSARGSEPRTSSTTSRRTRPAFRGRLRQEGDRPSAVASWTSVSKRAASALRSNVRARFLPASRHRTRQTTAPDFLVTFSMLTTLRAAYEGRQRIATATAATAASCEQ